MKSITHFFRLISPDTIVFQFRQFVVLSEVAQPLCIISSNPVSFTQEVQNDESGIYYVQDFSAVTADSAVLGFNRRQAVVEITLSDGSIFYMGTKEDPVLLAVTSYPDRYVLSCKSLSDNPVDL